MKLRIITPCAPGRDPKRSIEQVQAAALLLPGHTVRHRVVLDGWSAPESYPELVEVWSIAGPSHDWGARAINVGVLHHNDADYSLAIADDDELRPTALARLLETALATEADFTACHVACYGPDGHYKGLVTNDPAVPENMSAGLFRPRLFLIASMRADEQPGADGVMALRWLRARATMAIVPETLITHRGSA